MTLAAALSGLTGLAMVALGLNMIVPLSGLTGTLCELSGVACGVAAIGLLEGA